MHMKEKQVEMHAIAKGSVQGVFFRDTTRLCAKRLGINGSVKNLQDGTVEIYAQGNKDLLEQLIEEVKKNLSYPGYIKDIDISYLPLTKTFDSFQIIY